MSVVKLVSLPLVILATAVVCTHAKPGIVAPAAQSVIGAATAAVESDAELAQRRHFVLGTRTRRFDGFGGLGGLGGHSRHSNERKKEVITVIRRRITVPRSEENHRFGDNDFDRRGGFSHRRDDGSDRRRAGWGNERFSNERRRRIDWSAGSSFSGSDEHHHRDGRSRADYRQIYQQQQHQRNYRHFDSGSGRRESRDKVEVIRVKDRSGRSDARERAFRDSGSFDVSRGSGEHRRRWHSRRSGGFQA